ncbi:MAG: MFS transporter [Deltaproteobacteria bacterium]|nr:MFS transporter [Deltaproteobacteria bacterium]
MTKPLYQHRNLQIIFLVTLIAVMGTSSITPAFPKMIQALGLSSESIGLLITFFTLPGVILTPVLGILADRYGRKRILIPALLLFAIAGTACAFVQDFRLLLLLRFLQGMGAAGLGAINVTLIGDLYAGSERTAAMGYNAGVLSIGVASYPFIGGALAMLGWHYPFFLSLLALPVALLVLLGLTSPRSLPEEHFRDYLHGVWQNLKNRQIIGLFLSTFLSFVILFGAYLTYFPLLLGHNFEASPLLIGLMMTSMSLSTAITSSQLGRLRKAYSEKRLIQFACLCYAIALFIFPLVETLWRFLLPTILFGIAQGLNIPNIQSLISERAPTRHRGAFMSLNGMVLRLGQTIGPLFVAGLYKFWGVSAVFYASAVLAFVMFGIVLVLVEEV